MAAAAAPGGSNAGKGDGVVVVPARRMSRRAQLVRRWEDVFDNVGGEEAMELFMTLLLRDARAEHAAKRSRKEQEDDEEEEERRARVFEPWHPPPPGTAAPPPPVVAPPRVERTVVLGLRAPPHLVPRRKHERPTTTTTPSAPAAHVGRPANNNARGGV